MATDPQQNRKVKEIEPQYAEGTLVEIDCVHTTFEKDPPCSHAVFVMRRNNKWSKRPVYVWRIPAAVVAFNEGGHNCAMVCLDCANEAVAELRKELDGEGRQDTGP